MHAAPLAGEQATGGYWAANLRQTVRFGDTIARLAADGMNVFVELGPQASCSRWIRTVLGDRDAVVVACKEKLGAIQR